MLGLIMVEQSQPWVIIPEGFFPRAVAGQMRMCLLAPEGHAIETFDMSDALWLEVGDPKRLAKADAVMMRLPPDR